MNRFRLTNVAGLVLAAGLCACVDGRSERELAVAAAAMVESGDRATGLAMFAEALERHPESVELRIRMASVLVEDGRLAPARVLLDEAEALPMRDDAAARLGQVHITWLEATAARAAGRVEGVGADADLYRSAVLELVNRRGDPADRQALSRLLLENARAALSRNPGEALSPEVIGDPELATPEQAQAGLDELDVLLDENGPLGGRPELSDPALQEARALQTRLRHIVRGAAFDDRFLAEQRPGWIADGRYDVQRDAFIVLHVGPWGDDWPDEPTDELMRQLCQYTVARSTARQFASALVERDSWERRNEISFDVHEFDEVDVRSVEQRAIEDEAMFACEFLLPYRVVRRAALLLMDRLAAEQSGPTP